MKKYHQLLLLIISFVSIVLVLVYRHEYNRLHYVLEVFNFFGHPCNISQLKENISDYHDWGPTPLWQENENSYVYSAFWINRKEAQSLVLSDNRSVLAKSCYLWFENKRKPVVGKLKYTKILKDVADRHSLFWYRCAINKINHLPYAVSFSVKNKVLSQMKRILLSNTSEHVPTIKTTICVPPTPFNKSKIVEFISYHKTVGVDSYIFYGGAIPHKFSKLLMNLSSMLNIEITFFPWNFPYTYSSLVREIVINDCILRNQNQSHYVVVLETDEYLVPKDSDTLDGVLNNFKLGISEYALPVEKFCIEVTDLHKPVALLNKHVVKNEENIVNYIYKSSDINETVSVQKIDRDLASVHKYIHCNKIVKTVTDDSMDKFFTDFVRSTLYQLFIHNQL